MTSQQRAETANLHSGPVDFAIVTALKIERDAMLQRLDMYNAVQEDFTPFTYYRGFVTIPGAAERYEVVVVMLLGMGNDEAAIATTRLIQRWQPANVLLVGIAGGVPGKVALGDVVVADFCYYYELAKRTPKGEQRRAQQFLSDRLLYGRALAYEASEWKGDIGVARPDAPLASSRLPEAHFGAIGSGEKVIADKKTLPRLLQECPKLLAVAMEGAGVARAATHHDDPPRFLEVRAICDFADIHKNDDWHSFAANAAAAFTIGFLRSRPLPPLSTTRQVAGQAALPLFILRVQSLRKIAADEVLGAFGHDLKGRDIETVALDFTDLVERGALTDPEAAVRRLTDPQGTLLGSIARRGEAAFVFHGLAHIPLVVLAGHFTTDRQSVRLFDFHPSPGSETWAWPDEGEVFPPLAVSGLPARPPKRRGDAVVRISVSYPVLPSQTRVVVPRPVFAIDLAVPQPVRNIVRSEAQTRVYGRVFRDILDTIAGQARAVRRVHLFYAGPMALAFHLGQQISENIHPPVIVWNFSRSYEWGIDLAAALIGAKCVMFPSDIGKGGVPQERE